MVVICARRFEIFFNWTNIKRSTSRRPFSRSIVLDEEPRRSYLVTSTNLELDRLREEQERKEDEEMEQESVWERLQRRQPLADLSKKSTGTTDFLYLPLSPFSFYLRLLEDTVNARSSAPPQVPLRVPPLKIKLLPSDTTVKPSNPAPSLESRFKCALKLDRLDLSAYNISNKPASPPAKEKKVIEPTPALNLPTTKTKPLTISKSHEHQKPLKRLNTAEPKKAFQISKDKHRPDSLSIRLSISKAPAASNQVTPSISPRVVQNSTPASVCQEKTAANKKKKKLRPDLPPEYQCSIFLTRIDLSLYDIDLPDTATSTTTSPVIFDPQTTLGESHLESGSNSGTLQGLNDRSVCENCPTRTLFFAYFQRYQIQSWF